MDTRWKVLLSCFMGAFIGSVIALEIYASFWWIGVIIGGPIAYIGYSGREFFSTMRSIWKKMPEREKVIELVIKWPIAIVGTATVMVIVGCMALTTLLIAIHSLFSTITLLQFRELAFETQGSNLWFYVGGTLFMLILAFWMWLADHQADAVIVAVLAPMVTPIAVILFALIILVALCALLGYLTYVGVKLTKKTFIAVHSDVRLLCLLDASLGIVIGYFCGNALLGGASGAILGLLNYQIVSLKWLKLTPRV